MKKVRTTCAYCGVGCGILATEHEGKTLIEGDPAHPANFGRLCSKGLALGDTMGDAGRLAAPIVDGQETSWKTATKTVADRLEDTITKYGPDSVAFYVSGQLLTEDYYIANKLMKGFIGSANIDTNSRLCMSSAVAGHKRAFGADIVPGDYTDLEEADLVVLAGSNLAWCHPVLFQRLKVAKEKRGTKIVVIDPRRTETCDIADLHIPIQPGGDVLLFNSLLVHLDACGAAPASYTSEHVDGYKAALKAAKADEFRFQDMVRERGIESEISEFFTLFARTDKTATLFSQGINQAHNGTDRVNAIINCHLATGRIGQPGTGPFSVTGQPNAMGGREVGGLAHTLAAHMDFSDKTIDRVSRFWQAPNIATTEGLRAVDMFDAVHDGRIKAIWIMATNPAVSLPNSNKVREALKKCPLVIVSDCICRTDTQQFAHIRLPAAGWGEKEGTVTNSDRTISRQRAFKKPFALARPDWQIMRDVAGAMGWRSSFSYECPADIFREHAALSYFENSGERLFDLGALKQISDTEYDALVPGKWPQSQHKLADNKRLFGAGGFITANGKAHMIAICHNSGATTDSAYPILLNTGRYRDQWHTMTRTGTSHKLTGHRAEPWLDICVEDAVKYGLNDKSFARVSNNLGRVTVRVRITADQKPGEAFLPIHWSGTHAANATVGGLIAPTSDPISAQPAFKTTAVAIQPMNMAWQALLLSKDNKALSTFDYWTRSKLEHCTLTRMAGSDISQLDELKEALKSEAGQWLEATDPAQGILRCAVVRNNQLDFLLLAGPSNAGVNTTWLQSLFNQPLDEHTRRLLLAGRSQGIQIDNGPIICSCFQVGQHQIDAAIRANSLCSVEAIGAALSAGTNCGSCIPELRTLIHAHAPHHHRNKETSNAA